MITFKLSTGDFLDRCSIANLKFMKGKLSDKEYHKFASIRTRLFLGNNTLLTLYDELLEVNSELWVVEDEIREAIKERRVLVIHDMSVDIVRLNDRRAKIKKEIDILVGDNYDKKVYAGEGGYDI